MANLLKRIGANDDYVGIDFKGNFVAWVKVKLSGSRFLLCDYGIGLCPETGRVVIAMPWVQVKTRKIWLDQNLTDAEIEHYLMLQAEDVFANSHHLINVDFTVLRHDIVDEKIAVLVAASETKHMRERLQMFKQINGGVKYKPSYVDIESYALLRLALLQGVDMDLFAMVLWRGLELSLLIIEENYIVYVGQLNLSETKNSLVVGYIEAMLHEFAATDGLRIKTIALVVADDFFCDLAEQLRGELNLEVIKIDPFTFLSLAVDMDRDKFTAAWPNLAVACGLALYGRG